MNVTQFISNFSDLLDASINEDSGYELWFGTKDSYNTKRQPSDKDALLEPFPIYPTREGVCKYNTSIVLWLAIRRNRYDTIRDQTDGQITSIAQTLVNDASDILKRINQSEFMHIRDSVETIEMTYYESDSSSTTVNLQSMLRIPLNVTIWV